MSTYEELVYMVLDELKGMSDDFTYNENHVIFLLEKYRNFLLKQKYSDIRKEVSDSNYQSINIDLIEVPSIVGEDSLGTFLRSKNKVPNLLSIGVPKVYPKDCYYISDISFVSKERMKYVGHNKYLKNVAYCSIGPDNYLYLKSSNPQFLYLEQVEFSGIFQDTKAYLGDNVDIMKEVFPIEDSLVPPLVELIVKELGSAMYRPEDTNNNAHDDLEGLAVKTK